MAVGTGAISLDEVRLEMGLGATASLQDCVNNAVMSGLSGTYYTAPLDSLSDFRGYSHPVGFYLSGESDTTSGLVCGIYNANTLKYHNGASALPVINDTVYTDAGLTTTFNGASQWWTYAEISTTAAEQSIQINASGVVLDTDTCYI